VLGDPWKALSQPIVNILYLVGIYKQSRVIFRFDENPFCTPALDKSPAWIKFSKGATPGIKAKVNDRHVNNGLFLPTVYPRVVIQTFNADAGGI
jgi:hypothetical protein